jgi:tetratricopeptide (TPR) repeat protein
VTGVQTCALPISLLADAARTEPTDLRERAWALAARELKVNGAALEQYLQVIKSSTSESARDSAKMSASLCANLTGMEAVAAGDLAEAARCFDLMRDYGITWVKEAGQARGDMVRKLAANQRDAAVRIAFAQKFWLQDVPALGSRPGPARSLLLEALALKPAPAERVEIYRLAKDCSQTLGDLPKAAELMDMLAADTDASDEIKDAARFSLAHAYAGANDVKSALKHLHLLAESASKTRYVPLSWLSLADLYQGLGDDKSMLKYLLLTAEAPKAPLPAFGDIWQNALVRLGTYYQAKGEYAQAIEYFKQWSPTDGCGNGADQVVYERDLHIAQCLIALNKTDEALSSYLLPHITGDPNIEFYCTDDIPRLVVQLYEGRGGLDKLLKTIAPTEQTKLSRSGRIAYDLTQIRIWRRDGQIDKLMEKLKHGGSSVPNLRRPIGNYWAPAAAVALAELGGKEFPALKDRYEAMRRRLGPDERGKEYGDRMWVIYAIGLSKVPEARTYLLELKKALEQQPDTVGVYSDDLNYALSLNAATAPATQPAGLTPQAQKELDGLNAKMADKRWADEADFFERPEAYPKSRKSSGEAPAFLQDAKKRLGEEGVKVRWNAEKTKYEVVGGPTQPATRPPPATQPAGQAWGEAVSGVQCRPAAVPSLAT